MISAVLHIVQISEVTSTLLRSLRGISLYTYNSRILHVVVSVLFGMWYATTVYYYFYNLENYILFSNVVTHMDNDMKSTTPSTVCAYTFHYIKCKLYIQVIRYSRLPHTEYLLWYGSHLPYTLLLLFIQIRKHKTLRNRARLPYIKTTTPQVVVRGHHTVAYRLDTCFY